MGTHRYHDWDVTDAQWQVIEPLLPVPKKRPGALIIVSAITSCDGPQQRFLSRWGSPFARWPGWHRDVVQ
jgi:transposase